MYDLLSLMEQHDQLDAMADRLITLSRSTAASAECRALMDEVDAVLAAHLDAEAEFLYGKVPALTGHDNDNEFAATMADFERDFSLLDEHWLHYLQHWTEAQIEAGRAAFQSATSDLMTALKLRIARENSTLYPMALETGRISLRPGA